MGDGRIMTDLLTHQCRFNDCINCPEPMRCEHTCHLAGWEAPPTSKVRAAARRVWGRWT